METLLLGILTSALYELLRKGIEQIPERDPLRKAIRRTAEHFKGIEGVDTHLEKWLLRDETLKSINEYAEGKQEIDLSDLSRTLVAGVGFYYGEGSTEKATEVLQHFFEASSEELLKGEEGPVYLAKRFEAGTEEMLGSEKKTQDQVAKLDDKTARILAILETREAAEEALELLSAERKKMLEEAKSLVEDGHIKAAKRLFGRFTADRATGDQVGKEVLFQAYTGLAQCHVHLAEYDEAADVIEQAYSLLPNDEIALANMAWAKVFKGEPREGLRYADLILAENDRSVLGNCTKLEILADLGRFEEALSVFERKDELLGDPRCCHSLGYAHFMNRDYEKAKSLLEKAIEKSPKRIQHKVLLATVIAKSKSETPTLPWKMAEETVEELERADSLLSEVERLLINTDRLAALAIVLTNRSAVRLFLNRPQDAISDSSRVIEIDDSNSTAYRNKGIAQVVGGEYEDAIYTLSLAIAKGEPPGDIVPKMMRASLMKVPPDPASALELADKYCSPDIGKDIDLTVAVAESHMADGSSENALKVLNALAETHGSHPRVLMAMAAYEASTGETSRTEEHLLEAHKLAEAYDKQEAAMRLGKHYFNSRFYDAAIPYYEEIVNVTVSNGVLKEYVICLYKSTATEDAYKKCLQICEAVREHDGVTDVISDIEARIHEELGNLKTAGGLYSELSRILTDGYEYEVRHAVVEFRRGNEAEAVQLLDAVKDKVGDSPEALMSVAQVFHRVGRKMEAIRLAYQSLELAPNDADINLAYVQLFLSRDDSADKLLSPEVVNIDTVVSLRLKDEQRTFTILDSSKADMKKGEVYVKSDLGPTLLGCKVGDRIQIGSPESPEEGEVIAVTSKYVKAFAETLMNFDRLFDDERLRKVRISEDFTEVFKVTDDIHEHVSKLIGLYRNANLPICALSRLLGRNILEVWEGLRSDPKMTLRCATGSVGEQQAERQAVSSAEAVVVDLTGLLTLGWTDCLAVATEMFRTIYVSQSTIDEIGAIIAELKRDERARLQKDDETGKYILVETKPEEINKKLEFMEYLKAFVTTACEAAGLSDRPSGTEQDLREMFGESFGDSILIAEQKAVLLYSDDGSLRQVAQNEFDVKGFNIQSLLYEALTRKLIDLDFYSDRVGQLVTGGYHYVSVSGEVLFSCVRKGGFEVTPTVVQLSRILEAPETIVFSAAAELAEFVKRVWMEPIGSRRRYACLDLALVSLIKRRGIGATVPLFMDLLSAKMRLLQPQLDQVVRGVKTWIQGRGYMF